MTIKIAITGGIGSGKSTFSNTVIKNGYKVHDSDNVVKSIYKKPTNNFLKHLNKIGLGNAIRNKKINKKYISSIIFNNKKIKKKLELYIFDIVRKDREKFIKNQIKQKNKICFFDIPLLFENNLDGNFNKVVCIIAKRKKRFERLKNNRNMTYSAFKKILKYQATDLERIRKSDIVIRNNLSLNKYTNKINKILESIDK